MKIDSDCLVKSYREIYELVGEENLIKIYESFKGQQLTFPMKMYDKQLVSEKVKKEYKFYSVSELTKKYGYSQRWLKEHFKEKGSDKNEQ
ncbi:Mor transcription activator family protein [Carnobacterium gallinarum]|uniref:hypothetical protein n=1 Tax=Carnobacterium gallinarum TaxID=2749 RepID=UPI00068ACF8E|nr:hypothetical protein [Carnobacterium gallinarum]